MEHCDEMLKEHKGDVEWELVRTLQENNVDISAYHGDSIIGNNCMHMGANGDQIINTTMKAMKPKIRHVSNDIYLEGTRVVLKQFFSP